MDRTEPETVDWVVARKQMERWYWWGIPTFFRCPWNEAPDAGDIAVLGIPHSSGNGSTERDQHLGPRAVRHVSALYRRGHGRFGLVPWDVCNIVDAGDVPLPEAMVNDISVRHIELYARRFAEAGTRLVSIGGDHSITGPLLKAVGGPQSPMTGGRPVALVHFDSHTDSYHLCRTGSGTAVRRRIGAATRQPKVMSIRTDRRRSASVRMSARRVR